MRLIVSILLRARSMQTFAMRAMGDCYVEGSGSSGADWLKVVYCRSYFLFTACVMLSRFIPFPHLRHVLCALCVSSGHRSMLRSSFFLLGQRPSRLWGMDT
jgi:hypothetical protein